MGCKIQNNSQLEIEEYVKSLVDFAKERMGFKKYPDIVLADDEENSTRILGKTAYYDPNTFVVQVYTNNRHPKDILRSIAHELVHHTQHEQGEFEGDHYTGPGYAQKDPKMREMERQAYERGNLCLRDWEDGIKAKNETIYKERSNKTMSLKEWKNNELNRLLMKKFGLLKESLEEEQAVEETIEEEHVHDSECGCPDQEDSGPAAVVHLAEEDLTELDLKKTSGKDPEGGIRGVGEKGKAKGQPKPNSKAFLDKGERGKAYRKGTVDVEDPEMEESKQSDNIREALKIAMGILESKLEK